MPRKPIAKPNARPENPVTIGTETNMFKLLSSLILVYGEKYYIPLSVSYFRDKKQGLNKQHH
jgi:hypothetical protein